MIDELCNVAVENAAELSKNNQEAFREIRRNGFGASDSSVVLGVNPFPDNNEAELIRQKISDTPTAVEQKIGDMVNVRKGSDLEPIIIQKFADKFDRADIIKPPHMYELKELPFLKINFDGILKDAVDEIPVEVKFISTYGMKYYDRQKCIETLEDDIPIPSVTELVTAQHVKDMAKKSGIPVYYYTQIQQQLMGTGASHAFLSGLFDKDWTLYTWKIYRDEKTIEALKLKGYKLWQKIEQLKNK